MSGVDFLLDTNVVLGLLQANPDTLALIDHCDAQSCQCAYSAITRMELLGFTGITPAEKSLISDKLAQLTYVPISVAVEDEAIRLRCTHRIKLPDAIIVASALLLRAELLTHDKPLAGIASVELSTQKN